MHDLTITFIQCELQWENKDANLQLFSEKISSIREKTDLIVLPEMFNTGFTMRNKAMAETTKGKTMDWMRQMAKKKNCVVTGSLIVEEKKKYYNCLVWMLPNGKFEIYNKRHLFRYANEQNYYTAGNKKLIVELKGWKICPLICYDLRFPVWIRNKWKKNSPPARRARLVPPGMTAQYDVLLFVANWPERRNHPWKTLLMARAMENQCYVVGVNRIGNDGNSIYHSGDSAVLNFKGEIISKTQAHKESVETITFSKKELNSWRMSFPAWMDADAFEIKN